MQQYQRDFLDFALSVGVLRFGEFKLKSGRISPYFFNAGLFNTGGALARLGNFYAETIIGSGIDFDLLYGPAYKGIPLAAVTSSCLAEKHNRDLPYAFNRKEAKDHGEGGTIIGSPLRGHKVLIIDDVISAGTSVRESVNMIKAHHATPAGAVIALDRQERGQGRKSAIQEVQDEFGMPVAAIVCLEDLITYLDEKPDSAENLARIEAYRAEYGV